MVAPTASDVFLSYSRADADAVKAVRARLTEAGVTSFLDRTRLPAGQPWQPFLERELGRSGAVAVFLGPRMGSWQHREVQVALDRQGRERDFPVIPILLPGLDDEPKGFLAQQTWIDLRAGIDDPDQLRNLIAAIHRKPIEDGAAIRAAICPYRGLLPFREEDAAFFFGREDWTSDLVAKVQAHPLVAVVGRSGSGKSSLVFAGLFPALRRSVGGKTWDMLALRPGHEPLHALAAALSPPPESATPAERIERINADADRLRRGTVRLDQLVRHHLDQQRGTDRLLLYVDQWEELYTLAAPAEGDGEERTAGGEDTRQAAQLTSADVTRFIDLLLATTAERDSPLKVVLTVRADFYDHLLRHPTLPAAIQGRQLNLGPMTRAQLQRCIEGPASAVRLRFEGDLIESILDEVGEDEGKLPLLEYALRETWEASRKAWQNGGKPGLLTFAAYNGVKGVAGAIGTRAQQIYERLDEDQRQAARRLFVSLVTPGEGREDTRARATVPDEPAMADVVRKFSAPAARLLVTGRDPSRGERLAEVSHEALIRNWGTLRSWIEANREILRTRERIRGQMRRWEEEKEPDDLLLQRGRALEEGRQLLASHGDVLIDDVRSYVERSIDHDERLLEAEQRDRDEAQRQELERERELRQAQELMTRRTRLGLIAASTLLLIAAIAGAFGWWQQRVAVNAAATQEITNQVLQATIDTAELGALARARQQRVLFGFAPEPYQLAGLVEAHYMLARLKQMEIEERGPTQFAWSTLTKEQHQRNLRMLGAAVDQSVRMILNSLWLVDESYYVYLRPLDISTEIQPTPICLAKEIARRQIAVHSLIVVPNDNGSGWHAFLAYEAGPRQMALAAVDGTTCHLTDLGFLPPNAHLSRDFDLISYPDKNESFLVERLRWYPVCEWPGGYPGRAGCRRGGWKFTREPLGRSDVLRLTENPELLADGNRLLRQITNLAPRRITDEDRLEMVRDLFKDESDHDQRRLRIKNVGNKDEQLVFLCGDKTQELTISEPLLAEQRISAFDLAEGVDVSYAAYLVSQKSEQGTMGHLAVIVKLDKCLSDLGDASSGVQAPGASIEFQGPKITGLRFGTQTVGLEGVLLLESKPTDSFFEVVWSQERLREIVCHVYQTLPQGSKELIRTGSIPHTLEYLRQKNDTGSIASCSVKPRDGEIADGR